MCIAEGFPSIPFYVNEDLTRSDGVIQCTKLGPAEFAQMTWRELRALMILLGG